MSKDPRGVMVDAARRYIEENAGMWAGEVERFVPGLIATLLAALARNGLAITITPPPEARGPE